MDYAAGIAYFSLRHKVQGNTYKEEYINDKLNNTLLKNNKYSFR